MRLSMLRATTMPWPTTGDDRISEDSWASHSFLPSMSNASSLPLAPPSTMTSPSVPTPAVRSMPAIVRQIWRPDAASARTRVPSPPAAMIVLPASAGVNI